MPAKCPNCGEWLMFDEVDVGVGRIRGPAGCPDPDCDYADYIGLCEPDGRVPLKEVPKAEDVLTLDTQFHLSEDPGNNND